MFSPTNILEIPPTEKHVGTVIMFHGMGDNNAQWRKLCLSRSWPLQFPHVKFLFPGAPARSITLVKSPPMAAWFDILTTNDVRGGVHDEAGLDSARAFVEDLVKQEVANGISSDNVLLTGFSQGGALALYAAARMSPSQQVGGVFALSSYLPMVPRVRSLLEAERAVGGDKRTTTFYLANGTNDPQVKFPWAEWSEEALRAGECNVRLISYLRVGHWLHPQSMADLAAFINEKLPYDISYDIDDEEYAE